CMISADRKRTRDPLLKRVRPPTATANTTAAAPAPNKAFSPQKSIANPTNTGPERLPAQLLARYHALAPASAVAGTRSPSRASPSGYRAAPHAPTRNSELARAAGPLCQVRNARLAKIAP